MCAATSRFDDAAKAYDAAMARWPDAGAGAIGGSSTAAAWPMSAPANGRAPRPI